ncbi:hypothetical protein JZ751_019277 [Albula glossodonta]|uniref:Purinergic receptor n=1 Tax=Albula glossodonta TaxID=121402 RepID=A0A8T2NYK1_9TELE|nr:hypothetical protein JZ751_019277 [Albula glossodonta]
MRSNIADAISTFFLEYETPRQVVVKNRRVGVVCRLIQLIVLVYIIGWVFIYEKGYQVTDKAIGSVYTKMKGVGYTKVNGVQRVWDVDDYVFPEQGDASFVVMTNYIMTMGQQQGNCPELPGKHSCQSDEDCEEGDYRRGGHGMLTGKCVSETKTCEVSAWCPVENDLVVPDPPLLMAAENFTLFIKNSITFPMFGIVRSNLVKRVNLRTCVFHEDEAPLCPIFRLGDIVRLSGFNFQELAVQGGAIGILIDWTCDFDWDRKHCLPKYNFHGLYGDGELMSNSSVGYNFRCRIHVTL